MAVTLMAGLSRAMAPIAAMTAAPPAMSPFICSIPSLGLIEIPPESKVIPFPTNPKVGCFPLLP